MNTRGVLALAVCMAALAGVAQAQPDPVARRATLYEYPNFQGASQVIDGRNDTLGDTGFEDRAMSGRFEGPWKICEDDNYGGHCETVSGDVRNLDHYHLGHAISSLRAVRLNDQPPGAGPGGAGYDDSRGPDDHPEARTATLYEYPHLQGRSYIVNGRNDGLGDSGFEDKAMSGTFDGPWRICEDDNYQGHCETVSGEIDNLDHYHLGHAISSLRAERH